MHFSGNDRDDRPHCGRCGHYSHTVENCIAKTHWDGTTLSNPSIDGISLNDSMRVYHQNDSHSEGDDFNSEEDDSNSEGGWTAFKL